MISSLYLIREWEISLNLSDGLFSLGLPLGDTYTTYFIEPEEEPEEEMNEDCPESLDALVSRSISDRLVFAFYGNRYWIYKR